MSYVAPTIAVIGAWHQASVVSACFADMGYMVRGVGEEEPVVEALNEGRAPVYEPGLDELIARNVAAGRLHYGTSFADGLRGAEFAFICIDTPVGPDDESDLAPIDRAVEEIAQHASGPLVLCVSAQVPIGTCSLIAERLEATGAGEPISVVYVPEFLRLGTAIRTFREADRFVIGSDDPEVAQRVAALYEPLGRPIAFTGVRSAEMAKHASNAFLATSITFINQIADLCEQTGADVTEVARVLKLDQRIGASAFLGAGIGYAGGTLGREITALRRLGDRLGVGTALFDTIALMNADRIPKVVRRLQELHPRLHGLRIGLWGLTYKSGTSTLRRSPGLDLAERLQAEGAIVSAFDPLVRLDELPESLPFDVCSDPLAAARGASALVLVVPWDGMAHVDFFACAEAMVDPVLLDTGNFLPPVEMVEAGFSYVGVGR